MKPQQNLFALPYSSCVDFIVDNFFKYKKKHYAFEVDTDVRNFVNYIYDENQKNDLDNFVELMDDFYTPESIINIVINLDNDGKTPKDIKKHLLNMSLDYFKNLEDKRTYKKFLSITMPHPFKLQENILKNYQKIFNNYTEFINNNQAYKIKGKLNVLKEDIEDFNKRYGQIDILKFKPEIIETIDKYLVEINKKIKTPYKPTLNIDDGIGFGVDNKQLEEDYNKVVEELKSKTADYNTLSIANKQLQEDYNKKIDEINNKYINDLNRLDKEFNETIKSIKKDSDNKINELKKKAKLNIGDGVAFDKPINKPKLNIGDELGFEVSNKRTANINTQTALPSLYITEFKETYNQQGDYNKRVEVIQENAKRNIEAIKNIYNQAKEDLQDEFNNLTAQLKEEYRNKKIRQNEYFEIPSKEQPEDNNTTNKLVLTNNKIMADITPQMKLPPIDKRITPPPEATGKEEEDKPIEEPPTKDIVDDANIIEEEDEEEEDEEEEDKEEEDDDEEDKEEDKEVIPINKVSSEISNVIDMFYNQDTPIDEAFVKFEKTIKTIPEEVYYAVEPYICKALANITVGDQKMFKDEEEVRQLIKNIRNKNKIHKIYKLPKKLDKAIKQTQQRHLTISPMLLRNRKQTNINKNIYQY